MGVAGMIVTHYGSFRHGLLSTSKNMDWSIGVLLGLFKKSPMVYDSWTGLRWRSRWIRNWVGLKSWGYMGSYRLIYSFIRVIGNSLVKKQGYHTGKSIPRWFYQGSDTGRLLIWYDNQYTVYQSFIMTL